MFIGEAPGELENTTGVPFVGISGRILHQLFKLVHYQFQYLITNAVGCRPVDVLFLDHDIEKRLLDTNFDLSKYILDEDYQLIDWNRNPHKTEIEACKPHLQELIDNWKPSGIVYLGKMAESALPRPTRRMPYNELDLTKHKPLFTAGQVVEVAIPTLSLLHPAYIARMEYKLLTVVKEARKLNSFLERIHEW